MRNRTTKTTEGKKVTFQVHDDYYLGEGDKSQLFKGFEECKYLVLYTTIKHDKGYREVNRWGTPTLEDYDNGWVGYQHGLFFTTLEEAQKDFEDRKMLTPKVGEIGYADIMLVTNN